MNEILWYKFGRGVAVNMLQFQVTIVLPKLAILASVEIASRLSLA